MKYWLLFCFLLIIIGLVWWTKIDLESNQLALITPTPAVLSIETESNSLCHIHGPLPDPNCTPGSIDPSVTQNNIQETICIKGYTASVRPPVAYTSRLKQQQILDYGYLDTDPRNYEEDHLISLELGGNPTDPKNLWPEPGTSPNSKDTIENDCHKKVCSGLITLADAQKQIATNWPTACH